MKYPGNYTVGILSLMYPDMDLETSTYLCTCYPFEFTNLQAFKLSDFGKVGCKITSIL